MKQKVVSETFVRNQTMSRVSFNLVFVAVCALILLANGSPIDSQLENEIIVCPEGATNGGKSGLNLLANFRDRNRENFANYGKRSNN